MADQTDEVTIRHPGTLEQQTVPRRSVRFFPGWELLDKAGRKAARQPTDSNTPPTTTNQGA